MDERVSRPKIETPPGPRRARKSTPRKNTKRVVQRRLHAAPGRPRTPVAIVDDQALVREAIAHLIDSMVGFRVVFTSGDIDSLADDGLARAASLIVVDAALAGSDLLALSESQSQGRATVRVLLLDEFPSTARLRRARRNGAAGYVSKCDTAAELAAVLRHVRAGGFAFATRDPAAPVWRAAREGDSDRRMAPPARSAGPSPADLTPRERQILIGLAEGLSVKRCAEALEISPNTVDNHKTRIMRKLGVHKTVDLTRFALRHGLIADS